MLIRRHGALQCRPGLVGGRLFSHTPQGVDDARGLVQESVDDLCLGVDQFVLLVTDGPQTDHRQEHQKDRHEKDEGQIDPQQQMPHEKPLKAVFGRRCLYDHVGCAAGGLWWNEGGELHVVGTMSCMTSVGALPTAVFLNVL